VQLQDPPGSATPKSVYNLSQYRLQYVYARQ